MTVFGINAEIVIAVLFALLIILAVMLFILYRKLTAMSRKYYALTSGSQGADLEHIITTRFKEIDKIKKYVKKLHKDLFGQEDYEVTDRVKDISSRISANSGKY